MEDPRSVLELGVLTRPVWWEGSERRRRLTAHKRERAASAMAAWRERVLGPSWLPPPFSFCLLWFHFLSVPTDESSRDETGLGY